MTLDDDGIVIFVICVCHVDDRTGEISFDPDDIARFAGNTWKDAESNLSIWIDLKYACARSCFAQITENISWQHER